MAKRNMDDTMEFLNLDNTMELLNLEEEADGEYYLDDTEDEDDYFEAEVRIGKGCMRTKADNESVGEDEEGYEEKEYEEEEYDEEYEEDEYEEYEDVRKRRRPARRIKKMDMIDRVVAVTGSLILILALVLGGAYMKVQTTLAQVASFEDVGMQMDGITVIGESGLLAIADAQTAKEENAKALEEAAIESVSAEVKYEEKELYEKGSLEVEMHLSSIERDLKIKFINKETGRLIPSVPFEVDIVTSDGKSYMLVDEDMDGIVYQTDVAPGKCSVAMNEIEGAEEYFISTEAMTVDIKDKIEYKKVDVADEVKTEAEVNAEIEDTKRQVEPEEALTDTVDWVESSKQPTAEVTDAIEKGEYQEVSRENITDPALMVSVSRVHKLAGALPETQTEVLTETQTEAPAEAQAEVTTATPAITLDQTAVNLYVNKTLQIRATITGLEDHAVVWRSDNEAVAVVAQDGTITGISPGSALIEAACNADNNIKVSCQVTVKDSPEKDTETKLKDNDGNQLYVLDSDGNLREAVYADYYTAEKFYKKTQSTEPNSEADAETDNNTNAEANTEYKYTGWQTIDGNTYYFDVNGNKVTGEQVIQGVRYTFDETGVLSTTSGNMGIDVSKWNGQIDWNAVKNSGVSYVIIRCGYRGSTTGALIEDPNFRANIQGASSAGLKVGIYFFTQAVNEVEAVEEASMVAGLISGYHISYPVFLDVEPSGGRADGISKETRTAVCRAFCQTIQNSGYTAGIYANSTWLQEKIDTASLADYKIWLAQYTATPTYNLTRYDLWQYSAKGQIAGINGDTDLNISYLGY